jgi:hypothetical protein
MTASRPTEPAPAEFGLTPERVEQLRQPLRNVKAYWFLVISFLGVFAAGTLWTGDDGKAVRPCARRFVACGLRGSGSGGCGRSRVAALAAR